MKKVFIFEIKKLLIPLAIYLIIMSILGCTILVFDYTVAWTHFTSLYGLFLLFLIIGIIYKTFTYNKKRISADMTYSLPVTKRELFVGKYLAALASLVVMAVIFILVCLIIFTLAYISRALDYSTTYGQSMDVQLEYFLLGALIQIAITIPMFNFILLFYYKANTILDGIVYVGLGLAIVFLVSQIIIDNADSGFSMFPLLIYVEAPKYFFEDPFLHQPRIDNVSLFTTIFIIYAILGYLISIYLIWFSKKDCSIRTQGLSNGIFGYRVFLPLTAGLIPILIVINSGHVEIIPLWYILIGIALFIGYCIYHRNVKFNKESYIVFASTLGFNFFVLMIWMITQI
ncbi:MAG: hypothetical protein K2F56_05175 [Anaeroplasmataceae bacterium]|nr:hypothetical protein [Anaeroplasmataceae bacterium]